MEIVHRSIGHLSIITDGTEAANRKDGEGSIVDGTYLGTKQASSQRDPVQVSIGPLFTIKCP